MAKKTTPEQKPEATPSIEPSAWQKITGATDPNESTSDKTARGIGGVSGAVVGGAGSSLVFGPAKLVLVGLAHLTGPGVIVAGPIAWVAGTVIDGAIGAALWSRGAKLGKDIVTDPVKRETIAQKIQNKFGL